MWTKINAGPTGSWTGDCGGDSLDQRTAGFSAGNFFLQSSCQSSYMRETLTLGNFRNGEKGKTSRTKTRPMQIDLLFGHRLSPWTTKRFDFTSAAAIDLSLIGLIFFLGVCACVCPGFSSSVSCISRRV